MNMTAEFKLAHLFETVEKVLSSNKNPAVRFLTVLMAQATEAVKKLISEHEYDKSRKMYYYRKQEYLFTFARERLISGEVFNNACSEINRHFQKEDLSDSLTPSAWAETVSDWLNGYFDDATTTLKLALNDPPNRVALREWLAGYLKEWDSSC